MNKIQQFPTLYKVDQPKSAFVDLRSLKKNMDKTFKSGKEKGEVTHFAPIDKIRNFTWKRGFLYCITGNPGSGKSEFVNHLATLKSRFDGWKWNIYSPESYPVEDLLDTMIHGYVGKSTDPDYANQMTKAEYDKAFDFLIDHIQVYDFPEMPTAGDMKDAVAQSKGADGIIIDPFNSIDTSSKEMISEGLKIGLTSFKNMALKNKMAVVLIEHPKSGNRIDEETGQPKEPTEYDLYGGSMWHNKCDIIGVVHRPFIRDKANTMVTFNTLKVKNQKLHGYPDVCEFNFNRSTNRYFWRNEADGKEMTAYDRGLTAIKDLNLPYPSEFDEAPF